MMGSLQVPSGLQSFDDDEISPGGDRRGASAAGPSRQLTDIEGA